MLPGYSYQVLDIRRTAEKPACYDLEWNKNRGVAYFGWFKR